MPIWQHTQKTQQQPLHQQVAAEAAVLISPLLIELTCARESGPAQPKSYLISHRLAA